MSLRRFEYQDQQSAKFWAAEQQGQTLQLRWGLQGHQEQSQRQDFTDAASAQAALAQLMHERVGKVYQEVIQVIQVIQVAQAATPSPAPQRFSAPPLRPAP